MTFPEHIHLFIVSFVFVAVGGGGLYVAFGCVYNPENVSNKLHLEMS